jgi:hypothetical protein
MRLEFSKQILEERSSIKFHQNPSSGSRVLPRGRTDRQTDMTKRIVAFSNFPKLLKKRQNKIMSQVQLQTTTQESVRSKRESVSDWATSDVSTIYVQETFVTRNIPLTATEFV